MKNLKQLQDLLQKAAQFNSLAMGRSPSTQPELVRAFNEQLRRVDNFLPNAYRAKQVFDHVKALKSAQQSNMPNKLETDAWWQELQRILIQLEFFEQRVPNAAKLLGIKEGALAIIKNNLKVLMDGLDFSKYQHYTLMQVNQPRAIDLDEWESNQKAKRDLGF